MAEVRPRRRRTALTTVSILVLAAGAGGVLARQAAADSAPRYRTTQVVLGSIDQGLALAGTAHLISQSRVTVPAAGVVSSVAVVPGDQVSAGAVLARMDPSGFTEALTRAKAQLAAARATLETDTATSTSGSTAGSGSAGAGGSGGSPAAARQLTTAMAAVTAALRTAGTACAPVGVKLTAPAVSAEAVQASPRASAAGASSASTSPDHASVHASAHQSITPTAAPTSAPIGTPSGTPSGMSPTTPSGGTPPASTPSGGTAPSADSGGTGGSVSSAQLQACISALVTLSAAEQRAATAVMTTGTASGGSGSGSSTGSSRTGTSATAGAGGGAAAGSLPSAVREITDRAAVATAQRAVELSEQQLASATLTAPISGVIGAVELTAGHQASSSSAIVVIGPGAARIDATLSANQLAQVRVGQAVEVRAIGSQTTLDGTVSAIGPLPTSTGSTVSYPVQITVAEPGASLADGAPVTAAVVVGSVTGVPVIPVSALTGVSGTTASVQVLDASAPSTVQVQVGAVGQGRVQIVSGLAVGRRVVIADLSAVLPSNSTQNLRRLTGNGGGFAPQGAPGGGAPAAGPPPGN